jgi:hypothetical protein
VNPSVNLQAILLFSGLLTFLLAISGLHHEITLGQHENSNTKLINQAHVTFKLITLKVCVDVVAKMSQALEDRLNQFLMVLLGRAVYGWSATPLQWILQYWTPVEWTPVGVGVEWSEPSPTPVLQWTPRLNLG